MDYVELSELVSNVQNKLNFLEVIPKSAKLRKDGKFYLAKCPFHNDAGESLIVNPIAKKFYCKGCHVGGGILQFIALMNKISLQETIERQAKNFNVNLSLPRRFFNDEQALLKRRTLMEINDYARDFYHEILTTADEGEICRKYLESRGITSSAIEKFQLGFAPNIERKLTTFLNDYDFDFRTMFEAGLIELIENSIFDKFRERVIIPLLNPSGHTTAIIGRAFNFEKKIFYESDEIPEKFVYPAENILFNKSKVIFGFNEAQKSIVQSRCVIIVDDFLDAITLNCAGIENVVATFENFFTSYHAEFLTAYVEEIIFCVKNGEILKIDEETLRNIILIDNKVSILDLPKNPAEFVIENGKEIFLRRLENRIPFDKYEHSEKVISKIVEVREHSLPKTKEIPKISEKGESILKNAWKDAGFLNFVLKILPIKIFTPLHQEIFEYLKICAEENKRPTKKSAKVYLGEDADDDLLDKLSTADELTQNDRMASEDAIDILQREIKDKNFSTLVNEITTDKKTLNEKLKRLKKYYEQNE